LRETFGLNGGAAAVKIVNGCWYLHFEGCVLNIWLFISCLFRLCPQERQSSNMIQASISQDSPLVAPIMFRLREAALDTAPPESSVITNPSSSAGCSECLASISGHLWDHPVSGEDLNSSCLRIFVFVVFHLRVSRPTMVYNRTLKLLLLGQ
jgi:hypothetical protein